MAKVLYTSSEVRKKVIEIMADDSCKRIIVVAFVGKNAQHYLNRPKGIKLICWPKPGSTNPFELKRLQDNGVELFFCNNLHMKIFHSEKRGTVLGSANLSTNAIGSGRQQLLEAGVYLNAGEFDLTSITDQLNLRKPLKSDWNDLYEGLKSFHVLKNSKEPQKTNSFNDWLKLPIEHKLKIAIYDGFSKFTKEELKFGPELPFKLTPKFKIAFAQECKKYGIDKLDNERHKYISDAFLKSISKKLS